MTAMNKNVGNEVLLTLDDVRQWQADLQKWELAKADAEERANAIRKKLDAAALLSGTALPPMPLPGELKDEESLGDGAKRLLAEFHRSVYHHELQAELRKVPRFRAMLEKSGGAYYYTMINRLAKAGDVKKAGKKIRLVLKNETPSEGNPEGARNTGASPSPVHASGDTSVGNGAQNRGGP